MAEEWKVKTRDGSRTLHSGSERTAREYVRNNFPRPHVVQGNDSVTADVQMHSPDGTVYEHHGLDAVGADEEGWVNLNATDDDDTTDDDDDDETEQEVTLP